MIDPRSLNMIASLNLFAITSIAILHRGLLAMTIDNVAKLGCKGFQSISLVSGSVLPSLLLWSAWSNW